MVKILKGIIMNYIKKFYGQTQNSTPSVALNEIAFAWIGGFIAICLVGYLTNSLEILLVMSSFGASCVLLFAFPSSPFSQPRNVILGHFFSTLVGLIFLYLFGDVWWAMAMALAISISIMMYTKTVHPPAGSNPVNVFLLNADFDFLFTTTLLGSVFLVLVALLYINLHPKKSYPQYWY